MKLVEWLGDTRCQCISSRGIELALQPQHKEGLTEKKFFHKNYANKWTFRHVNITLILGYNNRFMALSQLKATYFSPQPSYNTRCTKYMT